jgi:tetratricopeptide (TPR) repeat protein
MTFLDHYAIHGPLGTGAGGSVLRGVHRATNAAVAVKIAKPTHLGAYRREIFSLAGLSHPHIARVLDLGTFDEHGWDGLGAGANDRWYSMPLASGGTLEDKDPTSWAQVHRWLLDLLDGLAKTHARGIVHRDIKPANILFGGPTDLQPGLMIADFGIAWDHHQITNRPAGTPGFMAPEQARPDGHIGPWTDLHALGMVVWWCVAGTLPFHHPNPRTHLLRSMALELPPLEPLFPCPDGLEAWIAACCNRDIGKRLQRVSDARDLLPCLNTAHPGPDASPLRITTPELFSLLQPDPVERVEEQRALWRAVEEGLRKPGRTVIALEGPEGVGRQSLATWAGERAHMEGFHFVGLKHIRDLPGWASSFLSSPTPRLQRHLTAMDLTMGDVQRWHAAQALQELALDRPVLFRLADPDGLHHLCGLLEAVDVPLVMLCAVPTVLAEVTVPLAPLSAASMRRVLHQRIQGHDALADQAIAQAGGLPGRAIATMSHLLSNGPEEEETLEMGLASAVNRVLSKAPRPVRRAMERAATLGERVSLTTWEQVLDDPELKGSYPTALELLVRHGFASADGRHLTFEPGVRVLLVGLTASRGHLDDHRAANLRHVQGAHRAALLLEAGRVDEANAALAKALPEEHALEGPAGCLALLRIHAQTTPLTGALQVARVRYLVMVESLETALEESIACLAEDHAPLDRLELLRWNEYCRRKLRRDAVSTIGTLYAAAIEQRGLQALLALRSTFWGYLASEQPERALRVLHHVETCATGAADERAIRGELEAQLAHAIGDLPGMERASRRIEEGAEGAPHLLRIAWVVAVEVHHARGELEQARAVLEKMMRVDETHRPGHNVGFNYATLASIEVSAGNLERARRLTEAARTRSKDGLLARACAHLDLVFAAGVDPETVPVALATIASIPVSVPDPSELRLLEHALQLDPNQPQVRALLVRHQASTAEHRIQARSILGEPTALPPSTA